MATTERDDIEPVQIVDRISLWRAVLAGLVGGLAFGLLIQFALERMTAIGAMYTLGEPSLSIGWVAHLFHSVLFGAAFGLVSEHQPIRGFVGRNLATATVAGAVFGVILWSVNIVVLWPLWLQAVSFGPAAGMSVPFLAVRPLVGHVIYGLITGGLFGLLVDY